MLLRINNIISKNKSINLEKDYLLGDTEINLNKLTIKSDNKTKKINLAEKKVLMEMLSNPGKTYSREEIGKISGINQERSIDVMVTRLRQKIETNQKTQNIFKL